MLLLFFWYPLWISVRLVFFFFLRWFEAIFLMVLFIWLCWIFVAACGTLNCGKQDSFCLFGMQTLSCGIWDLVPWTGFKPGSPALQAWSVNHWPTREVPQLVFHLSLFPDLDLCDTICIYFAIVIIYLALSVYQCARPLINSFTLLLSSLQRTIYLKPIKNNQFKKNNIKLHNPLSQASSKTLKSF